MNRGARLDRRLQHVLEVAAERDDVLGAHQRAVGVDDAPGDVVGRAAGGGQQVGRDAQQRHVVERRLARHRLGRAESNAASSACRPSAGAA